MTLLRHWISGSLLLVVISCLAPPLQASCGGSFCSVNTQWETQGAWTGSGLRIKLDYASIDQNQLRHATRKVAPEGIAGSTDELGTRNHTLNAAFDYALNPDWAIALQVPFIQRDHDHIVNNAPPVYESWKISGLGDMHLLARRQWPLTATSSAGIRFGVKVPTGKIGATNAEGVLAERSLQTGSGTTDAIVGAYYYRQLEGNATTAFAQTLWQRPVTQRDGYEPGQQVSVDIGLRYAVTLDTSVLLQTNLLWKDRDQGVNAEPEESGGSYVYLSPGINHALTPRLQVYGFVQLPLYQYVNGTQLIASKSMMIGLSWR